MFSFTPKHKRLINACYPADPSKSIDLQKLSILIHHIHLKPDRLFKVLLHVKTKLRHEISKYNCTTNSLALLKAIIVEFPEKIVTVENVVFKMMKSTIKQIVKIEVKRNDYIRKEEARKEKELLRYKNSVKTNIKKNNTLEEDYKKEKQMEEEAGRGDSKYNQKRHDENSKFPYERYKSMEDIFELFKVLLIRSFGGERQLTKLLDVLTRSITVLKTKEIYESSLKESIKNGINNLIACRWGKSILNNSDNSSQKQNKDGKEDDSFYVFDSDSGYANDEGTKLNTNKNKVIETKIQDKAKIKQKTEIERIKDEIYAKNDKDGANKINKNHSQGADYDSKDEDEELSTDESKEDIKINKNDPNQTAISISDSSTLSLVSFSGISPDEDQFEIFLLDLLERIIQIKDSFNADYKEKMEWTAFALFRETTIENGEHYEDEIESRFKLIKDGAHEKNCKELADKEKKKENKKDKDYNELIDLHLKEKGQQIVDYKNTEKDYKELPNKRNSENDIESENSQLSNKKDSSDTNVKVQKKPDRIYVIIDSQTTSCLIIKKRLSVLFTLARSINIITARKFCYSTIRLSTLNNIFCINVLMENVREDFHSFIVIEANHCLVAEAAMMRSIMEYENKKIESELDNFIRGEDKDAIKEIASLSNIIKDEHDKKEKLKSSSKTNIDAKNKDLILEPDDTNINNPHFDTDGIKNIQNYTSSEYFSYEKQNIPINENIIQNTRKGISEKYSMHIERYLFNLPYKKILAKSSIDPSKTIIYNIFARNPFPRLKDLKASHSVVFNLIMVSLSPLSSTDTYLRSSLEIAQSFFHILKIVFRQEIKAKKNVYISTSKKYNTRPTVIRDGKEIKNVLQVGNIQNSRKNQLDMDLSYREHEKTDVKDSKNNGNYNLLDKIKQDLYQKSLNHRMNVSLTRNINRRRFKDCKNTVEFYFTIPTTPISYYPSSFLFTYLRYFLINSTNASSALYFFIKKAFQFNFIQTNDIFTVYSPSFQKMILTEVFLFSEFNILKLESKFVGLLVKISEDISMKDISVGCFKGRNNSEFHEHVIDEDCNDFEEEEQVKNCSDNEDCAKNRENEEKRDNYKNYSERDLCHTKNMLVEADDNNIGEDYRLKNFNIYDHDNKEFFKYISYEIMNNSTMNLTPQETKALLGKYRSVYYKNADIQSKRMVMKLGKLVKEERSETIKLLVEMMDKENVVLNNSIEKYCKEIEMEDFYKEILESQNKEIQKIKSKEESLFNEKELIESKQNNYYMKDNKISDENENHYLSDHRGYENADDKMQSDLQHEKTSINTNKIKRSSIRNGAYFYSRLTFDEKRYDDLLGNMQNLYCHSLKSSLNLESILNKRRTRIKTGNIFE